MANAEEILKKARVEKGYTQETFAEVLGISPRMYQRYEEGKFPKFQSERIVQIDHLLGTSIGDILYDKSVSREKIKKLQSKNADDDKNDFNNLDYGTVLQIIKDAHEKVLAEKEARRLDAEARLQKADDEKNRLFNLLEKGLARVLEDTDDLLAYQKAWVDLHAEELAPGDLNAQKNLLSKMGKLFGDRKLGSLPKDNVEAVGKSSKAKHGQHR